MDTLEKLVALEDIRRLLARRVRCIDEKDWDGFADCYTEDAVSWSVPVPGQPGDPTVGNRLIADRVAATLRTMTTVHQIHLPEIEVTGPDTATGIVPLEDSLVWEQDGTKGWMHAYGHYRQTYVKQDGRWRIKEHRLTRLREERGTGPVEA
jgi:uncharacterized protein (TIGR02246 family)